MKPIHAGLPEKFTAWRPGQEKTLVRLLYGRKRFSAMVIPVGSGKSATYMAYRGIEDEDRAGILCPTKALMDQVWGDFEEMGLVKIMGRDNYECEIDDEETAATAKCSLGQFCPNMRNKLLDC